MPWNFAFVRTSFIVLLIFDLSSGYQATGEEASRLVEPIYRVAHEAPPAQAPKVATRIALTPPHSPFNLLPQPGQHPLSPGLTLAKQHLRELDSTIHDYTALMIKQERINGTLGAKEAAYVKVRHKPFGVYMFFLTPNKGQECLYNDAPDGSKGVLVARGTGWKKRVGAIELDPEGSIAMRGQKYPIMKLGIRKMVTELIEVATNDMKFEECEVRTSQKRIQDRSVTLLEVVHPIRRPNFRFHKAQIFIDNELHIPIRYAAYSWPETPGGEPPLEEAYTYLNVKINNGFTDADFNRNNPAYFK